ncbi:hypothetical protein ACK8P5_13420 [Paenibacillus sp. EC2-1]|uniref:hypothetical protein n=1 Tax=Paenibacillus sp. EC2-1 TaxID=3388665 RepID=UPI003BEF45B7
MLVIGVSTVFAGCSSTDKTEHIITQRIEVSDFVLEVTTSTVIATGDVLNVKGTLTYMGVKPIKVTHGEPIIRFYFSGSNEERNYMDKGYLTEFKSGQIVEVADEFIATKKGKHDLSVNIDGFSSSHNGSLTMDPIEILVN